MDSQQPNDRMDTRNRIRDTAGQDQVRATPANPKRRPPADLWTPDIPTPQGLAETASWYRAEGLL